MQCQGKYMETLVSLLGIHCHDNITEDSGKSVITMTPLQAFNMSTYPVSAVRRVYFALLQDFDCAYKICQ